MTRRSSRTASTAPTSNFYSSSLQVTPRRTSSRFSSTSEVVDESEWVSGHASLFKSPEAITPKTRRRTTMVLHKETAPCEAAPESKRNTMSQADFKVPSWFISPPGVRTRSRRSSMYTSAKQNVATEPQPKKPPVPKLAKQKTGVKRAGKKTDISTGTTKLTSFKVTLTNEIQSFNKITKVSKDSSAVNRKVETDSLKDDSKPVKFNYLSHLNDTCKIEEKPAEMSADSGLIKTRKAKRSNSPENTEDTAITSQKKLKLEIERIDKMDRSKTKGSLELSAVKENTPISDKQSGQILFKDNKTKMLECLTPMLEKMSKNNKENSGAKLPQKTPVSAFRRQSNRLKPVNSTPIKTLETKNCDIILSAFNVTTPIPAVKTPKPNSSELLEKNIPSITGKIPSPPRQVLQQIHQSRLSAELETSVEQKLISPKISELFTPLNNVNVSSFLKNSVQKPIPMIGLEIESAGDISLTSAVISSLEKDGKGIDSSDGKEAPPVTDEEQPGPLTDITETTEAVTDDVDAKLMTSLTDTAESIQQTGVQDEPNSSEEIVGKDCSVTEREGNKSVGDKCIEMDLEEKDKENVEEECVALKTGEKDIVLNETLNSTNVSYSHSSHSMRCIIL